MATDRLTVEVGKLGGQPCIRGLRIPVAAVVAMAADGLSVEEIVTELPDLTNEDVVAARRYASVR